MSHIIFVYGTLRKGGVANHLMEDAPWLGAAKLPGQLYQIEWYPGVLYQPEQTTHQVLGDLYQVSDALLQQLDDYEGCAPDHPTPHEYRRINAKVETADGQKDCQFWEYAWQVKPENLIPDGDWLAHLGG